MKRLMFAAIACATLSLLAETPADKSEPASAAFKPEWMHIHAETQLGSAYHLYGAIFNDDPSWIYSGSVDFDLPEGFGSFGGGAWVLSDLTGRCKETNSRWNKETDFDVHWFNSYSFNDDWRIDYGVLYLWMNYYHCRSGYEMDTQRSFLFNFALENPYVTPYLNIEYQHAYDDGVMLEYGLRHEFEIAKGWTVTPSVYMTSASSSFFGGLFPARADGEDYDDFGIGSVFAKLRTDYRITDSLSVFCQATYMSVLNGDMRDAISADAYGFYHNDFVMVEAGIAIDL